jgi:hypothetical protein
MDEILKVALVPEKAESSSAAPKQDPGEKKERAESVSMPLPV